MERELLFPTNLRRRDVALLRRPILHRRGKQLFLSHPLRSGACLVGWPGSAPLSVRHEGVAPNNPQRPSQGRGRVARVLPASSEPARGAAGTHAFPAATHVQERRTEAAEFLDPVASAVAVGDGVPAPVLVRRGGLPVAPGPGRRTGGG